jgi:hypothetical protein
MTIALVLALQKHGTPSSDVSRQSMTDAVRRVHNLAETVVVGGEVHGKRGRPQRNAKGWCGVGVVVVN